MFGCASDGISNRGQSGSGHERYNRVALVIGNSAYQHTSVLTNPVNDARDLTHSLKALGSEVVSGFDLNAKSMLQIMNDFSSKLKGLLSRII